MYIQSQYMNQLSCQDLGISITCLNSVVHINSLSPGRYGCDFKCVNIKYNLGIDDLTIQLNIHPEWKPEDFVDGKSTLVQSGNGLTLSVISID